jgi:hypothetical protein
MLDYFSSKVTHQQANVIPKANYFQDMTGMIFPCFRGQGYKI